MPDIDQIIFVPRSAALEQLSAQDGLGPIADLKSNNPLPDAFRVKFSAEGVESRENQVVESLIFDQRTIAEVLSFDTHSICVFGRDARLFRYWLIGVDRYWGPDGCVFGCGC